MTTSQKGLPGILLNQGRRAKRWTAALALSSLAALVVANAAGPADVTFSAPASFPAGTSTRAVALGDFNNDNKLDLAVANQNSSNVSVLLGNGDGTLGSATNYSTGTGPAAIVAARLNSADQDLDLAIANFTSNTISVLLGSGTGVFGPARNYPAGGSPIALAAGDFDGDAHPDLVIANFSLNRVSILRNFGDGSFGAPTSYTVGTNPRAVVVGDFNGDGKLDLATANDLSGNVSLLLGNGNGTFQPAINFPAGLRPFWLAAGDLNNDQKLDLVVANPITGMVSVLLGKGDGTFNAAVSYAAGASPFVASVDDFNGDSKPDLAVGSSLASTVAVLLGNGNGTFQAAKNFPAGGSWAAIQSGDFNGDRLPDLVGARLGGNVVSLLLNTTPLPVTNQPPTVDAGADQTVECAGPGGALVTLSGLASDPDGDPLTFSWRDENGTVVGTAAQVQVQVPLGTHGFTLTVEDGHGHSVSDTVEITVSDSTPPSLSLSLTPNFLWPANHNLVHVTAQVAASDTCTVSPSVALVSIASNEPDDGLGDGDMPGDIQGAEFGTDDRVFLLRAERSGNGTGRVYTVRYTATDAAGNSAFAEAQVRVPHDADKPSPTLPGLGRGRPGSR